MRTGGYEGISNTGDYSDLLGIHLFGKKETPKADKIAEAAAANRTQIMTAAADSAAKAREAEILKVQTLAEATKAQAEAEAKKAEAAKLEAEKAAKEKAAKNAPYIIGGVVLVVIVIAYFYFKGRK